MISRRRGVLSAAIVLLGTALAGCGGSDGPGVSLDNVPRYPNAIFGESMAGFSPGGAIGANLMQFTTRDDYEKVLAFYENALRDSRPQVMSHASELGRQTAISIPQENGVITVAIQEFVGEGSVNITLSSIGR